jgi:hypothetical protein
MLTDSPLRRTSRTDFLESDRLRDLELPPSGSLTRIASAIESAMEDGTTTAVRKACAGLLAELSEFYAVPKCGIRVLAARPLRVRETWTSELFGDYSPDTMVVRVWMRTAVRKEVTSFGTFLSTVCTSFATISTSISSGFPTHGTLVASTNALARFTIAPGARRRSVCSGRLCMAAAGASTGRVQIAAGKYVS